MRKLLCLALLGLAVVGGTNVFSSAHENPVSIQEVAMVQDEQFLCHQGNANPVSGKSTKCITDIRGIRVVHDRSTKCIFTDGASGTFPEIAQAD